MSPAVVLVGPPGAGKTTVGRLLAARWGVAFADTDDLVEARAGRAIADIFTGDGEPAFRALEREAVAEALAAHTGVLALGGGAVQAEQTREALAGHPVVLLTVGLAAGVVAEALVALVLADAALEKFGGDSLAETARNAAAYRDAIDPLRVVGARPGEQP